MKRLATSIVRNNNKYTQRCFSTSTNFNASTTTSSNEQRLIVQSLVRRLLSSQQESQQRTVDLASLQTLIAKDANAFAYCIQEASQMGAQLRANLIDPVTQPRFLKQPVNVIVTGASGQIAYSLIPRILTGEVFGYDTPVNLRLFDIPEAEATAKGVEMEVLDCAFPLLNEIQTGSSDALWKNVDYVFAVGAKPRGKGMERGDLLRDNGNIFQKQGQLINQYANSGVLTLVVGNPANTNAMIAANNAPKIDKFQFSAMTRLDHDRALAQIADKINVGVNQLSNVTIWGNHSATQVPDVTHAKVYYEDGTTKPVSQLVDAKWLDDVFTPAVQQRGAAIINARGSSSAASAADAAIKHMADWAKGFDETRKANKDWTSMALPVDGIAGSKGVWVSVPVVCEGNGKVTVVEGVLDKSVEPKVKKSVQELDQEKQAVKALLK